MLVVVTGPPASGKTTLARAIADELRLPLLAKDAIKEPLYETLGTGDKAWSRRLGVATYALLFAIAAELLRAGRPLVLESNFGRGEAEPSFRALPPHRLLQLVCTLPLDVLLERYRRRVADGTRHPGHPDAEVEPEVVAAVERGRHRELDLPGRAVIVETSSPVALEPLADVARDLLAAGRSETAPNV